MNNKTILITGASRGLGRTLSEHWGQNNTVINLSRTVDQDCSTWLHHVKCDLLDEQQINSTISHVHEKFGVVDLLINNAGILSSAPVAVLAPKDIHAMISLNLTAPILISRLIFRKMMTKQTGQIINILSMASKLNVIGDSVYAATKSGLEAFSKILNKEGHQFGIHVNNIGISAMSIGMLEKLSEKDKLKIIDMIPHKQYAPIMEVISAIEFLEENSTDLGGQSIYFGGV
jgi:NAD(P)-dependent dehydrogenase (short-subunit alcohol dehydrogenase family)